jgi:hypothetical protein
MHGPELVFLSIIVLWLAVAAIVIGYPLVAGRIRAGLDTFSRADDPQQFWKAYLSSTTLFLGVSIAAAFFLHSILHWKL